MRKESGEQENHGSVWVVPLFALAIVFLMAIVDLLFAFYFLKVDQHIWMWALSSLITVVVASVVAEVISLNSRRALFSLILAGIVSVVIYLDIAIFLHEKVVNVLQGIIPNPLLNDTLYATIMTFIPGITIGGLIGAVIGLFPTGRTRRAEKGRITGMETTKWVEKYCTRCGYIAPFDSNYCPYCGAVLSKRYVPVMRFCRYCGAKVYPTGEYCPECGREIRFASRPEIYISE
ncbi:zinc ribbon domain-containing protein [Candidatus Bathyarchaeota archaeon]|mgnify:CR=1 FL=1|nr:MAG: zinc ribbon domain-containing protein [Candidatus Bathyarchaeota archaeon]